MGTSLPKCPPCSQKVRRGKFVCVHVCESLGGREKETKKEKKIKKDGMGVQRVGNRWGV